MEGTIFQPAISRKRKRKRDQKEIFDDLSANKQNSTDNVGIDNLSDDMLIAILSRMSLKEAVGTSVLSRRWKNLWMFAFRTLKFDDRDTANGTAMRRKKFKCWVNAVLKFYQPQLVESLIIHFSKIRREILPISSSTCRAINSWISFAIQKKVRRFELDFSPLGLYEFPNIEELLSLSYEVNSPFRSLRSLRLVDIDIKDEVVQYFLASCSHLEQLCIRASDVTKDLQFLDPLPNLKILEVSKCRNIQSLELYAANLVSFTYAGKKISLPFEKIPSLSELTLGEDLCDSFIFEPHEHSSYSVQLVKLVLNVLKLRSGRAIIAPPDLPQLCCLKRLELQVYSLVGRSVLFFTSLIKASPQLREFRIEIIYQVGPGDVIKDGLPFPAVSAAEAVKFVHENLKMVEMVGYVGCSSEEEFLCELLKLAPSLEMVVIDTKSDYYDDPQLASLLEFRRKVIIKYGIEDALEFGAATRTESKERAKHLIPTFPPEIKFIVK